MQNVNNDLARQLETKLAFAKKLKLESKPAIWQSRWLLLLSDETPAVKLTGETALMFADSDTGENIYPSIALLAALTGYSRRWVSQCMTRLQRRGYLQGTPQPGKPTRYAARVPERTLEELAEKLDGLGHSGSHQGMNPSSYPSPENNGDPRTPVHTQVRTPVHGGHEPQFMEGTNPSSHNLRNKGSEGKVRKNTHTPQPKSNGGTKPVPSQESVCVEDSFSWKDELQEEGQTQGDAKPSDAGKVIDFASKRQGIASPQRAEPSRTDAGSADERFVKFWRDMPRNTRCNYGSTLAVWQDLSADEQEFALDAVQHHRKCLENEAKAAGRDLEDHMIYAKPWQLPEQWLAQRNFYSYRDEVEKDRAERVPGFPLGVRRSDVRKRVKNYLAVKREKPEIEWGRYIFKAESFRNDHERAMAALGDSLSERLERGDEYAKSLLIADLGPAPNDPDCVLPDCIMDEFREEIASLNAEIERKRQDEVERERSWWRVKIREAMDDNYGSRRDLLARIKRASEGDRSAWCQVMRRDYGPAPDEEGTMIDNDLIELARQEMPHVKAREVVGL